MQTPDDFYLQQPAEISSCLLAMRNIILSQDKEITNELKYGMPFFCYKGKMFCYLWVHKKYRQPYIGFVEGQHLHHNDLLQEKRSRMKILLLDVNSDLPITLLKQLLSQALELYKKGIIKTPKK